MSDFTFTVGKVFIGTEKQRAVGIYGTFNMDVGCPDGIMITLVDMKLCKSKEGQWYIQSPYRTYEKDDGNGNKTTGKQYYYKLWPEEKNNDKRNALIDQVKREIESIAKSGKSNTQNKPAAPKPAAKPAPTSSSNDAW